MDAIFMQKLHNSFFFRTFASSISSGLWLLAIGNPSLKPSLRT